MPEEQGKDPAAVQRSRLGGLKGGKSRSEKISPPERKASALAANRARRAKTRIEGNPEIDHVSTSYVERSNFSFPMHARRFTRLTSGFSKKVENHAHSVALFAMYYNFVRVHKTLHTSPATAANVTKRLWEMSDIVDVLEAWDTKTAS